MSNKYITTAIYYRKPTAEEIAGGMKKNNRIRVCVPIKDVFLGVNDCCGAILKTSVRLDDGLRYFFECVNYAENITL